MKRKVKRTRTTARTPRFFRGWVDWLYYLVGSVVYALAVDMFTAPNHLVPGGVTGLSTMLNYLVPPIPIGFGIFVINVPLLIAAWRHIGHAFTRRTAVVLVLSSALIDVLAPFVPEYTGDPLLAALFGGVLSGVGVGLIFLRGATTGGSEIGARLLSKRFPHISIGRLILLIDGIVIALAAVVFRQLEAALYAVVVVFVSSAVVDQIVGGSRRGRTILIVTRRSREVADALLHTLDRGVTMLDAAGAYTGEEQQVLLCAVRPSEVHPLRRLVNATDPAAFMIVLTSDEVLGNGFDIIDPS